MINGGFTLGGVPAKELGIIMIGTSKRPILPPTVDRTISIPGRNGAWDFGADVGTRPFNLDCALIEQNAVALQMAIERLAALMVDRYGKPRTLELTFDTRPDRHYQVRYSGSLEIDRIIGLGRFTLPLVAFEPYAYGDERITEQTITASPTVINIRSDGDILTSPVIELTNNGTTTINQFTLSTEYQIE